MTSHQFKVVEKLSRLSIGILPFQVARPPKSDTRPSCSRSFSQLPIPQVEGKVQSRRRQCRQGRRKKKKFLKKDFLVGSYRGISSFGCPLSEKRFDPKLRFRVCLCRTQIFGCRGGYDNQKFVFFATFRHMHDRLCFL